MHPCPMPYVHRVPVGCPSLLRRGRPRYVSPVLVGALLAFAFEVLSAYLVEVYFLVQ